MTRFADIVVAVVIGVLLFILAFDDLQAWVCHTPPVLMGSWWLK